MTEPKTVMDHILARRSIRRYQERDVERDKLELLLQAAMAAPTAANSEPWEFVVVTGQQAMDALRSHLLFARYNAPAAIVVCGNPERANNTAARQYWVQDCSAAMENMLIAAAGLGLGAVWIGVYPLPSVIAPVRQALNIPEEVTPLGIAYVGYPAEERPPRTRYDPYKVHWQVYELRKPRAKKKEKHV